jgi:hypothetical protein
MKNFVRLVSLVVLLGGAGFQAGCASHHATQARRAGNGSNFEIVETSAKRPITQSEMAYLKVAVANYLEEKGATAKGDYYVKIFLGPDQDGVPADWVVVRFTRDSDLRFSMVAAYPSYSPGYNSSYYAYDYYPYGYDHYSRISFNYYPDPYYGPRYYFPPGHRRHNRDRDNDHDHGRGGDRDKDRDKDRDHDNTASTNPPRFKPIDPVGAPPRVTRNRGDDNAPGRNYQPRTDSTPQPASPPAATRSSNGGYATRSDMHRRDRDSAPRPESTRYTPPPSRNESSDRGGGSSNNSSNYSPPAYSPPAPSRSEPSSSSRSNQSHYESTKSGSQRERME